MFRAVLDHPDLPVTLDDLGFDLADLFVKQRRNIALAANDLLTSLDDAVRAERIGLTREAERRLRFLPRFEDRLVRPFRDERRIRFELVDRTDRVERSLGYVSKAFFKVLDWSRHKNISHEQAPKALSVQQPD